MKPQCSLPDFEPRATEYHRAYDRFIEELIAKGLAYVPAGDVYFNVASIKEYGKFSKQNIEQLWSDRASKPVRSSESGGSKGKSCRFCPVESAPNGDPVGIALGLWQAGWHTECSAMIRRRARRDHRHSWWRRRLVFPHHENEIAQSEALTGKPLARLLDA